MMCLFPAAVFVICLTGTVVAVDYWDPADSEPQLNEYFDNEYIGTALQDLQDKYPDLVLRSSLGFTPDGDHKIWEVTITANVTYWRTHNRPGVKYIANMHGNEVRGRGLIMKLAFFLTLRYSVDNDVRSLLQSTVFHLVPSANPWGFATAEKKCSGTRGRFTSQGFDMNRDFPDHWESGTKVRFAGETALLMKYAEKVPATLGLSFHDGALVANYPLDAHPDVRNNRYAASPDDALFTKLAKSYAAEHSEMSDTSRQCGSDNFVDGVTNGNSWYQVQNGMQDWDYFYNDCFELTIELGCCKYPTNSKETFTKVWEDNFESVFNFTNFVHTGIQGRVADFYGNPITGAEISVSGNNKSIKIRHEEGYYWRPLVPGVYNVTAKKEGYFTLSRRNIVVYSSDDSAATQVPFILMSKSQVRKRNKKRFRWSK